MQSLIFCSVGKKKRKEKVNQLEKENTINYQCLYWSGIFIRTPTRSECDEKTEFKKRDFKVYVGSEAKNSPASSASPRL